MFTVVPKVTVPSHEHRGTASANQQAEESVVCSLESVAGAERATWSVQTSEGAGCGVDDLVCEMWVCPPGISQLWEEPGLQG